MACEIPFVASGIGENNLIVNNNTNGYLANSKKEWVKNIMEAKYNKKKNKKMFKISKNIIKNKYSVEVIAKKFKKIIYDC